MTALVGIYCKDGVVIGSDSSASFVGAQAPTIEQKTKKVEIISGQMILSGTGAQGLGQRFSEIVQQYWNGGKGKGKGQIDIARELCAEACKDFSSTGVSKGSFGALLAFPSSKMKHPQLCEFALRDFQPEFKDENMWFVSMGSGQPITDPFLGLMRRVFWGDTPPTLSEGIFAVTWCLKHVIELNPGGINGPQQIAVLDMNGKARLLSDDELQEQINSSEAAELHLRKFKELMQGKAAESIPQADK